MSKNTRSEPNNNPSFEDALSELDAIVNKMESGQLPLQESLATYKRGIALLHLCQQSLGEIEQQISVLNEQNQLQTYNNNDD